MKIGDLCSAPGGKAAQLAARGARVVAVDRSAERLKLLAANFERLRLEAEIVVADCRRAQRIVFRCGAARCALLGNRHDTPASRHRLDEESRATSQSSPRFRPACSTRPSSSSSPAARSSIASARSNLKKASSKSRPCCAAIPTSCASPIMADDVGGLRELVNENGELRTLPSHLPGGGRASRRPRRIFRSKARASRISKADRTIALRPEFGQGCGRSCNSRLIRS